MAHLARVDLPIAAKSNKSNASIYQRIVMNILSRMSHGSLKITLPNKKTIQIGDRMSSLNANLTVCKPRFFKRCVLHGDIGFGESFVDGDWQTTNLTDLISWFIINKNNTGNLSNSKRIISRLNPFIQLNRTHHKFRSNTVRGSKKNISDHYDLSNDFFKLFLDPSMTYSCAYFEQPSMTLQEAQAAKYDRLCRLLKINAGDHVLEIGSGWGGFSIYAAKKYNCRVTTITISQEQYDYAKKRIQDENLTEQVKILLTDYRQVTGKFDKIVSIEMLEAVGHKYFDTYFNRCNALLKEDGLLGLQVITYPDSRYDQYRKRVDWIQQHIFPGSLLPSLSVIIQSLNRSGEFVLQDLTEMGLHYAKTLSLWRDKFNENQSSLQRLGFDERFVRKWNYYFSYCEAGFKMRHINVNQMIFSRPNNLKY